MAIARRKNAAGRVIGYTVGVSVPNPRGGRGTRYTVGTYRTRKLAEHAERGAKDEIQRGVFSPNPPEPPRVVTIADVIAMWFETKKLTIQPNSATGYRSAIELHLLPALGTRPVTELTHDDIQEHVNAWCNAGMGAQLIHRCVMILRASLARAVNNGTIPFNPAEGIEKPSARKRRPHTIWTDEQFGAFLGAAQEDRLAPFWFLTLMEGMRRSEALGLRWGDVHWTEDEAGAIATVSQTIVPDLAHGGRALIQSRAKTKSSQRTVMLTRSTIEVLKCHRDRQRFERQAHPDLWGDHNLITTTAIGTPVTPSTVKRSLRALIDRAGIPQVTTHGLRHMAATYMMKRGASPALVALKLGHSNIGTTVDIYGHLAVNDQAPVNTIMEAVATRGRAAQTGTADD